MMLPPTVTAVLSLMVALSIIANFMLPASPKGLAMQWSPSGDVRWRAPRWIALSFCPLLATCVTLVIVSAEAAGESEVIFVAGVFAVVHAIHLVMLYRTRN